MASEASVLAPAAETGDVDAEDAAGAGDAGEPGEAVDEEQHLVHGEPVRRWDWGTRLPTGLRSMRCNHHSTSVRSGIELKRPGIVLVLLGCDMCDILAK